MCWLKGGANDDYFKGYLAKGPISNKESRIVAVLSKTTLESELTKPDNFCEDDELTRLLRQSEITRLDYWNNRPKDQKHHYLDKVYLRLFLESLGISAQDPIGVINLLPRGDSKKEGTLGFVTVENFYGAEIDQNQLIGLAYFTDLLVDVYYKNRNTKKQIAHNIINPLTSIGGFNSLMVRRAIEMLDRINQGKLPTTEEIVSLLEELQGYTEIIEAGVRKIYAFVRVIPDLPD